MRRVMAAGAAAAVVLAVGGYATADVLDVAPGILTRDRPVTVPTPTVSGTPRPVVLPTPQPSGSGLLAATGEDAPVPTEEGLARAVAEASDAAELEGGLGLSVRDGVTGEEVYGADAARARVPASTAKLLTASAVADTLDLDARIPTTVVAIPGSSDLVLVARGDMLLAPGAGNPTAVAGHAGLADLAAQVAAAVTVAGTDAVTLRLDLSFAPGPRVPPTWNPNDVRDGFAGPVVMTGLATRRAEAGRPAPAKPEVAVAKTFAAALDERGVTATLAPERTWTRPAPEDAEELGSVESATFGELLSLALDESDNSLTESLARQAAATAGRPTAGAGAVAAFVRARLEADAVPTDGMVLKDASGLSPGQKVSPSTLSAVLARAVGGDSRQLREVLARLPVSGLSGTLRNRFTEKATDDVLGVPRAKTGTLRAGSSLAGTTVTADGRPLTFVVQVDGFPETYDGTLRARAALDRIVAALTRCGCR
ncbi:D-alanyl-D-alanine carboxypeptidase [Phycicoccus sp. CSK15P-2]|uniref:D-alanyl-D-alanine carboxypeptidase/D-alanyl-D-alanine-endopeptidase n=1 Tax=Phycicoccus sp. CSK15P-2 TaxID=2807627 RepID=UPI00195171A9|nr:D-alanyl-D-alanine carboxypeptidase [Phycicoccus sp. CSK15P-2]MBM6405553.1 D-alanyl-D-alanine carboxypeptidase [Phycicoccus sp. CSK15P-2]